MSKRIEEILKNKETRAQFESAKSQGKDVKLESVKPGEKPDHKLGNSGSNPNANSSNSRGVVKNNQPSNTPGHKPSGPGRKR